MNTGGRVGAPGLKPLKAAPRAWIAAVAMPMLMTAVAIAADESKILYPGGTDRGAAPAAGGTANLLTLLLALAIAAVGGWMYWRNRRAPGIGRETRLLSIEETRALGNRQYLVVAAYEGRRFLLGVCPGRIDLLAPLDKDGPAGESRS